MSEVYVIVVDSSRARVLYSSSKTEPLIELETIEHPEGRMHARDLTSDLPGRDADRSGFGKHRMDSATDPKQQEHVEFAKTVATLLDDLVSHKKVDHLMLVAPPAMLGLLREHLSKKVVNELSFELDKNLTRFKLDQIRSYLPYFKPVESML